MILSNDSYIQGNILKGAIVFAEQNGKLPELKEVSVELIGDKKFKLKTTENVKSKVEENKYDVVKKVQRSLARIHYEQSSLFRANGQHQLL
jgi:hypothetical protein